MTDWLVAVVGGNDKRAAELTALPFTPGGFQFSACKPATNPAELTAFVRCVSSEDLIVHDVTARALADQNSVAEEKDTGEHAAFLKEHAKDVKRLPAGHTRVHVGINGDGQYLEFLLTVKDGKITGGVFGGEAAE